MCWTLVVSIFVLQVYFRNKTSLFVVNVLDGESLLCSVCPWFFIFMFVKEVSWHFVFIYNFILKTLHRKLVFYQITVCLCGSEMKKQDGRCVKQAELEDSQRGKRWRMDLYVRKGQNKDPRGQDKARRTTGPAVLEMVYIVMFSFKHHQEFICTNRIKPEVTEAGQEVRSRCLWGNHHESRTHHCTAAGRESELLQTGGWSSSGSA